MTFSISPEITVLALACGLGLIQIILAAHGASFQRGYMWTASARDKPIDPLGGIAGRLERASRNFLETFPYFLAAIITIEVLDINSALTSVMAWIYLFARVAYLLAYLSGVFLIRSLIWNIATLSIVALLVFPWL